MMNRIRRRVGGVIVGAAILAGLTTAAALAWSGDTALTASSRCLDQKTGMAQVTYTVHLTSLALSYGGRTVVTASNQPGLVPVGSSLTNGEQFVTSVPEGSLPDTLAIKVNYPDHNGDLTQYPASATAQATEGCIPVQHQPSIAGSAVCSKAGQYVVTYTALDLQGGTSSPSLPLVHTVSGKATSDSASVVVSYTDGPDQTASATVEMAGTCKAPPNCTVANGCKAHYAPRARIIGPCGDPFYRVTFDNRGSNRAVGFSFSFHLYGGGRESIHRTVRAGHQFTTRYVHVLGFSRMRVWAGHKGLVAAERAAAPGNYRACA